MEEKETVEFEEYDTKFSEEEFDNMSNEDLKECKKIIQDIKKMLDE